MKEPPSGTREPTVWRIGLRAGRAGHIPPLLPPGIDRRAYVLALAKSRAARGRRVVRLPCGKK